jgi:two-component system, cell cycle sensor histidine kinase and response regulator CckA
MVAWSNPSPSIAMPTRSSDPPSLSELDLGGDSAGTLRSLEHAMLAALAASDTLSVLVFSRDVNTLSVRRVAGEASSAGPSGATLDGQPALARALAPHVWQCMRDRRSHQHSVGLELEGASVYLDVVFEPYETRDGDVAVFALLMDRTSERRASDERQAIQARAELAGQLEVVGRLAAGVAHDFNNVLTAIMGNTALLRMALERSGALTLRAEHIVDEIERASDRASALVRQLLTFTDQRATSPAVYAVDALLRDAARIVERLLPESVVVRLDIAVEATIRIDRGLFEQAIVNLAANAADAMPGGGDLWLTCRRETRDGVDAIEVLVRDSGTGMSEQVLARVLEPFFTTKPPGKGTGLGLVNVQRTMRQAGGDVAVESIIGQGTTMRLWLPIADAPATVEERPSQPREVVGGREYVFLCEDDQIVRQSVVGMLEQAGYVVQSATQPDEALRRLAAQPAPFDLVISDVVMPGMNGVEFIRRVRERYPQIPVLFISGYSQDVLLEQGLGAEQIDLLPKPFDYATLIERVKRALSRKQMSAPAT